MLRYAKGKSTGSRGQLCLNPARISQVVEMESEPGMAQPRATPSSLQTQPAFSLREEESSLQVVPLQFASVPRPEEQVLNT